VVTKLIGYLHDPTPGMEEMATNSLQELLMGICKCGGSKYFLSTDYSTILANLPRITHDLPPDHVRKIYSGCAMAVKTSGSSIESILRPLMGTVRDMESAALAGGVQAGGDPSASLDANALSVRHVAKLISGVLRGCENPQIAVNLSGMASSLLTVYDFYCGRIMELAASGPQQGGEERAKVLLSTRNAILEAIREYIALLPDQRLCADILPSTQFRKVFEGYASTIQGPGALYMADQGVLPLSAELVRRCRGKLFDRTPGPASDSQTFAGLLFNRVILVTYNTLRDAFMANLEFSGDFIRLCAHMILDDVLQQMPSPAILSFMEMWNFVLKKMTLNNVYADCTKDCVDASKKLAHLLRPMTDVCQAPGVLSTLFENIFFMIPAIEQQKELQFIFDWCELLVSVAGNEVLVYFLRQNLPTCQENDIMCLAAGLLNKDAEVLGNLIVVLRACGFFQRASP